MSKVIVKIPGNSDAFLVERISLFQSSQLGSHAPQGDVTRGQANDAGKTGDRERAEPPGLPDEWRHSKFRNRPDFIPDTGTVACPHPKVVAAGRKSRIGDAAQ